MNSLLKYSSFILASIGYIFSSCNKDGSICRSCDVTGPYTMNGPVGGGGGGGVGSGAPVAIAFYDSLNNQPIGSKFLTAKYSTDDGTIVSYEWKQTDGPSNANITTPRSMETVISNLFNGKYSFALTVTDNVGLTGRDTVQVTVRDGPTAEAGPDQTITLPLDSTYLEGIAAAGTSSRWTIIAGPTQFPLNPAPRLSADPTKRVVVASRLVPGVYLFTFTITDPSAGPSTDTVRVTVLDDPQNKNTLTYHNLVWKKANSSVVSWTTTFLPTPLRPDLWDAAGAHRRGLEVSQRSNSQSSWISVPFKTIVSPGPYAWYGIPYTGIILTHPDNPSLVGTTTDMRIKIL